LYGGHVEYTQPSMSGDGRFTVYMVGSQSNFYIYDATTSLTYETKISSFATMMGKTVISGDGRYVVSEAWARTLPGSDVLTKQIVITDTHPQTLDVAAVDATKVEGNTGVTAFTFMVSRTGAATATDTASVAWAVTGSGNTPANAADFGGTLPSGTLSFATGETVKFITVNTVGDTAAEENETFAVTLSNPIDASLGIAKATGTITDDDRPPSTISITIGVNDAITTVRNDVLEGQSGTTWLGFIATRSGDTSGASSVAWTVTGSGNNPADAGDFGGTLPSGTVRFADGETRKTIAVPVTGDTTVEPDETFTVTLSNPSGPQVSLGTTTATGTIRNDDGVSPSPEIDPVRRLAITAGGVSREIEMDAYSGPVAWLQNMHIGTDDGEAMRGTGRADFINTRGGDDAIEGGDGDDVLDGSTGSNFLTGGTGTDTFFVDGRIGGVTWSTVTDLENGEWITAWGWLPGISKLSWEEMSGAEGYKGATAHIDIFGNGSTDLSMTIAGKNSGALIVSPGEVNGSTYLAFILS